MISSNKCGKIQSYYFTDFDKIYNNEMVGNFQMVERLAIFFVHQTDPP
jgi:hypothetical protein